MMQTNMPSLELGGSQEEQALASQVWNLMRMRGFSYAMTRPISLTLEQLAEYFSGQKYQGLEKPEEVAPLIDRALSGSPAVFLREETSLTEEETDGVEENQPAIPLVNYKTTKSGKAPVNETLDQHSFKTRLFQEAKPVTAATEEEEAVRIPETPQHTSHAISLPVAATQAPAPQPASAPVSAQPQRPAAPAPAPAQPQRPAAPAPVTPMVPAVVQKPVTPAPAATPAAQTPAAVRPAAPVQPLPTPPQPAPAPAPVAAGPLEIAVADGVKVDVNRPLNEVLAQYGDYFASALVPALEEDFRFINFANNWYLEEITGRYNKGDFRRIREYMQDNEGPVSDTAIMADLWGKRTTDPDYEATRFALNFRLYKEKKDFEFVGAADDRVWTAPGLPQIGNPRHKATEIGTDYKFLEDPQQVDPSEITVENGRKVWRHMLTFYEYENGVLPYDASAREFFPAPLLEEQKSLVLRFEAPQLYFTYTAELRYPTGSRGGWVGGLEQFFEENLVPGAILVIRQGDKSNHFTIEYEQSEEQNANVLFYDERRQKFVFRPIVFACEIIAEGLLTPDRYAKLNGQKRLEDSDRKKTDQVVASAFEFAGQKSSQGYYALLDDLYPVVNIERPFSRNYLRHLLTHGNSMFQPDETTPDAFYYKPPQSGFRR
ncbi:MAG: hypothetical protein JWP00_4931 [Chloroflexi bacterium]|jgi:hypothetical protein|nr:hypothetical protein [Chloroflexota bacterium]